MPEAPIRLLLSDVDGTLVTGDKVLTDRAVEAVRALRRAGVLFAITSGRPPRGMSMLADPLDLSTPIAAFNGGVFARRDMALLSQKTIRADLVAPLVALLESHALHAWLYRGTDWYVRDPAGPHIDREAWTVGFSPVPVDDYAGLTDGVAKVLGVSDDREAVAAAEQAARARFGNHVSATRSQPYYLDVTHPEANKGRVAQYLAHRYAVPPAQIATIGDMPNDVLMFAHSGLSIAMGNADIQVQRAARHVTTSNEEEGFADAVERFVLRGRNT
ncbi:Cof-type HAD-IIB family hydrolase [Streptomyces caeni]|uniref:Cof-type HAD-IIB family hydrolase n=1 Tax=Streptomyces caeni TaxID=2307231 RepID=A0ABW4IPC3_9ACTN